MRQIGGADSPRNRDGTARVDSGCFFAAGDSTTSADPVFGAGAPGAVGCAGIPACPDCVATRQRPARSDDRNARGNREQLPDCRQRLDCRNSGLNDRAQRGPCPCQSASDVEYRRRGGPHRVPRNYDSADSPGHG